MLPRLHPRISSAQHQASVVARQSVSPLTTALAKVGALLRLDLSTPASGEWGTIVDVLNSGNPATQTSANRKPAVGDANGRPTMLFDDTDVLTWATAANNNPTTALELLFWIKPTLDIVTRQRVLHIGSPSNLNKLLVDFADSTWQISYYRTQANGRTLVTSTPPAAGLWQSMRVKFDGAGADDASAMAVFKDGVNCGGSFSDIGAGGAMTSLQAAANGLPCLIGGSGDSDTPGSSLNSGVEMGCMIAIVQQTLTDEEATALGAFLSPVDPLARSIVCDGDSITFGAGGAGGQSYPDQLRALFYDQDILVTNVGVAGKTTQALINDFAEKVAPHYRENAELVFFEQYNSFSPTQANNTVETEKALVQQYVAQAKAAGFKVWICTPLPTSDTVINDKIVEYSTWLRANHGFADGLIDLYVIPELTPPGIVDNPTYYSDSVHPTTAGYTVVAAAVYAGLTA